MFPCHAVLSRDVSRERTLATQASPLPFHCMTKLDAIPFVQVCDFLRSTATVPSGHTFPGKFRFLISLETMLITGL